MRFFQLLNQYSQRRQGWLLLSLVMLSLLLTASYFQHVMLLLPCVMCIYERVATIGVAIAGLIGLSAPQNLIVRSVALLLWIYSSIKGLLLSYTHVDLQLNPSPFVTCDLVPRFPSWLPLHEWIPSYFAATGDCSDINWQFIGLSMPQWLMVFFIFSTLAAVLVAVAQFFGYNKNSGKVFNYQINDEK